MKAPRFILLLVPIVGLAVTLLYWNFFAKQIPSDTTPALLQVFGPIAGLWALAFLGTMWVGWLRKPNASPDMKWQGRGAMGLFVGMSLVTTHFYLAPVMQAMGRGDAPELGPSYLWIGIGFLLIGAGIFAWNLWKAMAK